jgi:hypothetical protein
MAEHAVWNTNAPTFIGLVWEGFAHKLETTLEVTLGHEGEWIFWFHVGGINYTHSDWFKQLRRQNITALSVAELYHLCKFKKTSNWQRKFRVLTRRSRETTVPLPKLLDWLAEFPGELCKQLDKGTGAGPSHVRILPIHFFELKT